MKMIKNLIDMFEGLGSSMNFMLPPRDYIESSPVEDYINIASDFKRVNDDISKQLENESA